MSVDRFLNSYVLENEYLQVRISVIGASILSFKYKTEKMIDIMPSATPDFKASSFLMVPYSNRIRDGKLTMGNQHYQLDTSADPHVRHGDVRNRPWFVCKIGPRSKSTFLCLKFDSSDLTRYDGWNWPTRIACTCFYQLEGNSLIQTISVINMDNQLESILVGGGLHPYFNKLTPSPVLQMACDHVYPSAEEPYFPSGPPQNVHDALDFRQPKPLERAYDHCYGQCDTVSTINYPKFVDGKDLVVSIEGTPNLKHRILFNPMEKPYFAVEPALNCNDAFNVMRQHGCDSGLVELRHGEKVEFQMKISVSL
ncbi:hypothetical protein P9112_006837 [Eukaryota sp. TZLM1-RC]